MRLLLSWKFFDQVERVGIVLFGFGVRVEFRRVVSSMNQIRNRPAKIASTLKVHGQLSGNLRGALPIVLGQLLARLQVERGASFVYQIAVEKVLVKRMCEAITRRQGPVG